MLILAFGRGRKGSGGGGRHRGGRTKPGEVIKQLFVSIHEASIELLTAKAGYQFGRVSRARKGLHKAGQNYLFAIEFRWKPKPEMESFFPSPTSATTTSTNVTSEPPSPFLRYGQTYGGQTADKLLALSEASVAVLLTVDNWSKWALVDLQANMECGRVATRVGGQVGLPELVLPGVSEMTFFEKYVSNEKVLW